MPDVISYEKDSHLIQEADVLLFRGGGTTGYFLSRASESDYTHVAVASYHRDEIECVEFREGSALASLWSKRAGGGGRSITLEGQVKENPGMIDVYRPIPYWGSWVYNPLTKETEYTRVKFDPYLVTDTMRSMTGLPYGWKRIWWIAKNKMVGFRLFYDTDDLMTDELEDVVYPVCSTAVAYAFNKHGYDLIKNRSDEWTEPGDIATSGRLSFLFTITP